MDPDACLAEMRELVSNLTDSTVYAGSWGLQLAERVEALDEWLSKGGFPPAEWVDKRRLKAL